MLHDPSHTTTMPLADEVVVSPKETQILRQLGEEIAIIAAHPSNAERAKLWTNLNDLQSKRPMVWINEIPWHEMNVNDELTLRCESQWAKDLERTLRRTIYQWHHMPGDMVVNPYISCPLAIHSTDFGILEQVDIAKTDDQNDIVSRHFKIQIEDFSDLEKITMPQVTHVEKATERNFHTMNQVFNGIIPVKKEGQTHIWYTPWDYLIRWWGVEEAMVDMVMRPELVHEAYERMVQAWMTELDQFEAQNLLSLDCNNTRVGSGGYGYVSDLPGANFDPQRVQAKNMWGCSNAQICSSVSPDMHWEFALSHDLGWLSRWGHTYYGCCEPLDKKIHLLRKIPNLRKISGSPWCNTQTLVDEVGADYVISRKPNPAIFAYDTFNPEQAEKELRDFMEATEGGCHVELIMKDVSTVMGDPTRLWQWEKIAMKVANDYLK